VEAGANVVFIHEELPPLSSGQFENWTSPLAPIFNVIRFYQALPVLEFTSDSIQLNRDAILQHGWDCVVTVPTGSGDLSAINALGLGLAITAEEIGDRSFASAVSEYAPVLITTTDDVPPNTDVKRLTAVYDDVRHR
jgi:hypothetical protein